MIKTLLHIGYHKTGSSWLQKYLFTNTAVGFKQLISSREVARHLKHPNALDFDFARCVKVFQPLIDAAADQGLTPVISSETLSGSPHAGGYDSKELANRLVAVFPKGKVLIVIREQKSMLLSVYKQYVKAGGACSTAGYLQPPQRGYGRVPLFDFDHFKYDRLIRYYISLFGESNTLVLPYELFSKDPSCFVQRIAHFAGIENMAEDSLPYSSKSNKGSSAVLVAIKRRINLITVRDTVNPYPLLPVPAIEKSLNRIARKFEAVMPAFYGERLTSKMQATIEKLVGDRYRQSNCATSRLIGSDLREYGYDTESATSHSEGSGESIRSVRGFRERGNEWNA